MAPGADRKTSATGTAGNGSPAPAASRFGALWKHSDFMKYWSGQTVSQFGTQVTLIALPLVALLTLHAKPGQLGVLRFAEFLPFILLSLFVGIWLDRWRRKPVMVVANAARAVLVGLVPLLYVLDVLNMPILIVLAFFTGVFTVFFDVGYLSYIPALVSREHLVEANAKLNSTWSAAIVAGPGLGGFLVQVLTAPIAMVIDSLSYVVGFFTLLTIKTEEPAPPPRAEGSNLLSDLKNGLRDVFGNRYLRATAIAGGMYNFFLQGIMTVFYFWLIRSLDFSPAVLGLIIATGGVGGLLGAMTATSVTKRVRFGPGLVAIHALGTFPLLLVPAASGSRAMILAMILVGFFFMDIGGGMGNVVIMSLRQRVTPNRLMGRMNGSYRFIIYGGAALGPLFLGFLSGVTGLRTALWVGVIGFCAANVPIWLSAIPSLSEPPPPSAEDEPPPIPPVPPTVDPQAALAE